MAGAPVRAVAFFEKDRGDLAAEAVLIGAKVTFALALLPG